MDGEVIMRTPIIMLLIGCAQPPAPVAPAASAPKPNLAEAYVGAVAPDASCGRLGDRAVLCVTGMQAVLCEARADKRTECHLVADWTPKPATAPVPPTPDDKPAKKKP